MKYVFLKHNKTNTLGNNIIKYHKYNLKNISRERKQDIPRTVINFKINFHFFFTFVSNRIFSIININNTFQENCL